MNPANHTAIYTAIYPTTYPAQTRLPIPANRLTFALSILVAVGGMMASTAANAASKSKKAITPTTATPTKPSVTPATANTAPMTTPVADRIVAVVNDTPILQSQWQQAISQAVAQLKAQNLPLPPEQKLYSQVLDQLIIQQAQLDYIKRLGFKPEDSQVDAMLLNIARQNGVNTLPEFQQSLNAQQKGGYQLLRQQVSDSISLKTLQQQQVLRRVKITDQDVDLFLKSPEGQALKQNQYHTIHVRIPFISKSANPSARNVTEADNQKALTIARQIAQGLQSGKTDLTTLITNTQKSYPAQILGGDMGFHTASELPPELATTITALKAGQVSSPIRTATGYNVVKMVETRGSEQKIIPQWSVRHILVSPSATRSPAMAKQQIDTIYEQIRKGVDFATLAATYSDDPGSARKGGALGWVSEGEMVPEFEKTMKNINVNDFSTPFQSQFGWHILKVDAVRQQDVTDLYLRNQAKEVLFQRAAPQALDDWLQEVRSQSYIKIMDN